MFLIINKNKILNAQNECILSLFQIWTRFKFSIIQHVCKLRLPRLHCLDNRSKFSPGLEFLKNEKISWISLGFSSLKLRGPHQTEKYSANLNFKLFEKCFVWFYLHSYFQHLNQTVQIYIWMWPKFQRVFLSNFIFLLIEFIYTFMLFLVTVYYLLSLFLSFETVYKMNDSNGRNGMSRSSTSTWTFQTFSWTFFSDWEISNLQKIEMM